MAIGIEKLEMYAHVNEQLERFSYISDHAVNYSKSYVLLLGKHRARAQHLADDTPTHPDDPRHIDDRINWTTLETFTDKYRAGTSQSCNTDFQKLHLAVIDITDGWNGVVMVRR